MSNGLRRSLFHSLQLHPSSRPPLPRRARPTAQRYALPGARTHARALERARTEQDGREGGEAGRGRLRPPSTPDERTEAWSGRAGAAPRGSLARSTTAATAPLSGATTNKAAPPRRSMLKATRDGAISSWSSSRGAGLSVRGTEILRGHLFKITLT